MKQMASASEVSASKDSPVRGSIDEFFVYNGVERFKIESAEKAIPFDHALEVRGWATLGEPARGAETLVVYAAEKSAADVRYHLDRPDVAAHFGSEPAARSGFIFRIDPQTLGLQSGRTEVRVLLDGEHEAFRFWVEAQTSADERSTKRRYSYHVHGIGSDNPNARDDGRVECGFTAVVRGSLRDREHCGVPHELVCVVNRSAVYPVLLERIAEDGEIEFSTCVPTDSLALGTASLRFFAVAEPGEPRESSERFTFEVRPICLYESQGPYAYREARAAIAWTNPRARRGTMPVNRGETVDVEGWIVDSVDVCAARGAYLVFDDGQQFAMDMAATSADAVRAIGSRFAWFAGFRGSISTGTFEPGTHVARLYALSNAGSTLFSTSAALTLEVGGDT